MGLKLRLEIVLRLDIMRVKNKWVLRIRHFVEITLIDNGVKVEVDMDYHKTMLGLHLKANPKEVLIGWYVWQDRCSWVSDACRYS